MNDVRQAMKPPEQAPRDNSEVMANTLGFMAEHNLTDGRIDTPTVAIALHTPSQIRDADRQSFRDSLGRIVEEAQTGVSRDTEPEETYRAPLNQRVFELSRRARVKRKIAGLALTVGLGLGLSGMVAQADAAIQESNTGQPTTALDVMSYDESILPGDMGADIPFVNTLRRLVPGVPDRTPYIWTREVDEERTVTREHESFESSYDTAQTVNPASPDLSLTGEEYQLARTAAEELVGSIENPEQLTITSFGADGRVSDEFGGQLGQPNPEQLPLAFDRGAVAAVALEDVLREHGLTVPEEPIVTGHEVVLTPEQVRNIQGAALEEKLAADRGAELFINGRRRVVEMVPRTRIVRSERTDLQDQFPNEALMGIAAAAGIPLTMATASSRLNKPANRAARRELKRALKKAA